MVTVPRAIASLIASRLEYLLTHPWLIGSVALLTLCFGAVVVAGTRNTAEHRERYAQELQQRLQATLQPVGPNGRQVDRRFRVLRPPPPEAALIAGQEPAMPAAWDVGPGAVEALYPYRALNASRRLGEPVDGAAFVGQFGSLLALALGLATVLRDRRRGWTDAERGTSTSVWGFFAAHVAVAALALAMLAGIWCMTAWLVIDRVPADSWTAVRQAISAMAPLTWLYLITFYGYGAAIGWRMRAPFSAVALAGTVWVCLVFVGPQVASSWTRDLPSRARAEQDQRDAYAQKIREMEVDLGQQIEARLGDGLSAQERDRRGTAAFVALEPALAAWMAEARASANALERTWRAEEDRIAAGLHRAARTMPSTLFPQVLAETSGTGNLTRRRWNDSVSDYKRRLDQALFDDRPTVTLRLRIDGAVQSWMHVRHAVKPVQDLPRFDAPTTSARDRWRAAAIDVLLLLLHAAAALTMAAVAQRRAWRRYDFASGSGASDGPP